MSEQQQLQVWVRNDKGLVYGPLSPPSVELLIDNGIIGGRLQVSTNGENYVFPGRVPGLRMIFPKETWGEVVVPGEQLDAEWGKVVLPAGLTAGSAKGSAGAAPAAGPGVPGPPVTGPGGPVAGPGVRGPVGVRPGAAQQGRAGTVRLGPLDGDVVAGARLQAGPRHRHARDRVDHHDRKLRIGRPQRREQSVGRHARRRGRHGHVPGVAGERGDRPVDRLLHAHLERLQPGGERGVGKARLPLGIDDENAGLLHGVARAGAVDTGRDEIRRAAAACPCPRDRS